MAEINQKNLGIEHLPNSDTRENNILRPENNWGEKNLEQIHGQESRDGDGAVRAIQDSVDSREPLRPVIHSEFGEASVEVPEMQMSPDLNTKASKTPQEVLQDILTEGPNMSSINSEMETILNFSQQDKSN